MSAPSMEALRAGATALGVALSDRQAEQLLAYGAMIYEAVDAANKAAQQGVQADRKSVV